MNAMEMAAKVMLEKFLGNLPPEVLENIGQIGQTALSLKGQLDRIEYQQRLIMAHLNIPSETQPVAQIARKENFHVE
jgi:hypothetical protein